MLFQREFHEEIDQPPGVVQNTREYEVEKPVTRAGRCRPDHERLDLLIAILNSPAIAVPPNQPRDHMHASVVRIAVLITGRDERMIGLKHREARPVVVAGCRLRALIVRSLAFMSLNHFTSTDEMAEYAAAKGVPAAGVGIIVSGGLLMLGGLGIVLGVYPVVAAGMVSIFLLIITLVMHNFWAAPRDQRQREMTNFLKNIALFAASLLFLVGGGEPWAYALNIRMVVA